MATKLFAKAPWRVPRLRGEDAELLAAVNLKSERLTAIARVFVLGTITCAIFTAEGRFPPRASYLNAFLLVNLGISAFWVAVTHRRLWNVWTSWIAGGLDTLILIGGVLETAHQAASLPTCVFPARVATWGIFLAFCLSAMRGRPLLIAAQTLLFAVTIMFFKQPVADGMIAPLLPTTMTSSCGSEVIGIRISIVALAGVMLVIAGLQSQLTLKAAIVAGRKAASLSRYVAPTVASVIVDNDATTLREGRNQDAAILFADIRRFTTLSETLTPSETAALLGTYRRLASEAIEREQGTIDKYVGDEVMGVFGVPVPHTDDAARAIRSAQHLLRNVEAWSEDRVRQGLPGVKVGVGVHHGPVFAGVIGHERLEFTVVGHSVNTARRLEELTKPTGHDCIVSGEAMQAANLDSEGGWICHDLGERVMRGQSKPMRVFAVAQPVAAASAARPLPLHAEMPGPDPRRPTPTADMLKI